jgi:PAS domain S-box-containing protein
MLENEALWYSLIHHPSDVITILHTDGTILFQSPSITRLLGYKPEELIGNNAFQMVHPEDMSKVTDAFLQVVQNTQAFLSLEYRFKHKDGSWLALESTGSNQLDNELIGAIVINSRDVTERKACQDEREHLIFQLKDALAKIKTLTGLLPVCAWCRKIRDDDGYWKKVEDYLKEHTDASFTHGICPECLKKVDIGTYEDLFGHDTREVNSTDKKLGDLK